MTTRIMLIHAVPIAMQPIQEAFRRLWPEAACNNLLEDSLSPDRESDADLTESMTNRIGALADYALSTGASGILFTCSAFGAAIEKAAARMPIPVLKPNEAMFEAALQAGNRIGMLATFQPSVEGMEEEFYALARRHEQPDATMRTVCVPEAIAALRKGDTETHNRLVAEAAPQLADCDAVILAHFSTSRAEAAVSAVLGRPVQTSPSAAVLKLRRAIEVSGV